MRIVLLGPPASGKGTQGRRLAAHLGLGYLSTGVLLRENLENGTELGQAAAPILARGGYLPDSMMCPIMAHWLELNDAGAGWVLDGFPRSVLQATFLDTWLSNRGASLDAAVALDAPFDELLRRIRDRLECPVCRWSGQGASLQEDGKCPNCEGIPAPRADDNEANFRNRHEEFSNITIPVIDFYQEAGKLISIPASGSKDQTTSLILSHFI